MSAQKWTRNHPIAVGFIVSGCMLAWIIGWTFLQGYPVAIVLRDSGWRFLVVALAMGLLASVIVAIAGHFTKRDDR